MKHRQYHSFYKYVKLSVLLDILKRGKITLLSPVNWDDKNDSYVLEEYRKKKNAKYICATCFSINADSIHHWNTFSNGSEGCQIDINANQFLSRIAAYHQIQHGEVQYHPVNFKKKIPVDRWPFVKRKQFSCEQEYRLVLVSDDQESFEIDLDPTIIKKISLSDKMPKSVAESVKEIIRTLCPNVDVYCSTLNDNQQWKNHFK